MTLTTLIEQPATEQLELTQREFEVLLGISEGKENAEIAEQLHLSCETVKSHASSLFRKLGARNRAHAVALAFRLGVLRATQPVISLNGNGLQPVE